MLTVLFYVLSIAVCLSAVVKIISMDNYRFNEANIMCIVSASSIIFLGNLLMYVSYDESFRNIYSLVFCGIMSLLFTLIQPFRIRNNRRLIISEILLMLSSAVVIIISDGIQLSAKIAVPIFIFLVVLLAVLYIVLCVSLIKFIINARKNFLRINRKNRNQSGKNLFSRKYKEAEKEKSKTQKMLSVENNYRYFASFGSNIAFMLFVSLFILPTNLNFVVQGYYYYSKTTDNSILTASNKIYDIPSDSISFDKNVLDSVHSFEFDSDTIMNQDMKQLNIHKIQAEIINKKEYQNPIMNSVIYSLENYYTNPSYLFVVHFGYNIANNMYAVSEIQPSGTPSRKINYSDFPEYSNLTEQEYIENVMTCITSQCTGFSSDTEYTVGFEEGTYYSYKAICDNDTISCITFYITCNDGELKKVEYSIIQFTDLNTDSDFVSFTDYDCEVCSSIKNIFSGYTETNKGSSSAVLVDCDDSVIMQYSYGFYEK